jgi:hypothetical protein
MKKLFVPGKSVLSLTKNQWAWITSGSPTGEFQYRFWDFYFAKKVVLLSKMDNQPIAVFSVFLTGGGDTLSERKDLLVKTIKQLLRMYQTRLFGKRVSPDVGLSLWFFEPALEELNVAIEEELLRKFPILRLRQYVLLVNDFESVIELEVPDRLIEPEIVQ